MTNQPTSLTVTERASVALGAKDYELKLTKLVKSSVRIVEIKNADGYKEAHGARMALKNTRVEIEKTGKAAREDAQAFSSAVIAEQKRLVEIIAPEESRLQSLQAEWDAAREAEKQAAAKAEQDRIDRHRAGIDTIKSVVLQASNKPSGDVHRLISSLADDAGHDFEEFAPAANKAKAETLAALQDMLAAATAREAEAARLQAEREELARLRAEQEKHEAAERARIAAEQKVEAERLAAERRAFEEQQRIAREEQAALDRQAEAARREADKKALAAREAADREAYAARAEAEAVLRKAREQEEARAEAERVAKQAEADRIRAAEDAERKKAAEARAKTNAIRGQIDTILDAMDDEHLSAVLKFASGLSRKKAA